MQKFTHIAVDIYVLHNTSLRKQESLQLPYYATKIRRNLQLTPLTKIEIQQLRCSDGANSFFLNALVL